MSDSESAQKPATRRRKQTPPMLAADWGVGIKLVLRLIRDGILPAANVSSGGKRPRYLIDVDDAERVFRDLCKRTAQDPGPDTQKKRPQRTVEGVTRYYE